MGSQPFVVLSAIKLHLIKKNTEAGNQMKIHAVMSINFLQKVSWFYQVDKNTSPSNMLFWRCNKTEPGFTSSHRQLYPLTAQCGWWAPAWISWFSPCWTQYLQAPQHRRRGTSEPEAAPYGPRCKAVSAQQKHQQLAFPWLLPNRFKSSVQHPPKLKYQTGYLTRNSERNSIELISIW